MSWQLDSNKPHINIETWFCDVDKKKSIQMLKGKPDGTFLCRPSTKPTKLENGALHTHSVDIVCNGIRHLKVIMMDYKFGLILPWTYCSVPCTHISLMELVLHYSEKSLKLRNLQTITLKYPIKRTALPSPPLPLRNRNTVATSKENSCHQSERPEESSPPSPSSLPYSSFSSPPLRALENLIPRRSLELQESLPTCSFIMPPPPSYSDAFVNQDMELKGEQDTRPLPWQQQWQQQPLPISDDNKPWDPWFCDVDRNESIKMLWGKPNGTFLCRPATKQRRLENGEVHAYTLDIMYKGIKHLTVLLFKNKFGFFLPCPFSSLKKLILFYSKNSLYPVLATTLKHPIKIV